MELYKIYYYYFKKKLVKIKYIIQVIVLFFMIDFNSPEY